MATVAELESRVAELEKKLDDLTDSVLDLAERDTANNEGGTVFEKDDDGNIVDHDGKYAPTADATGRIVANPNGPGDVVERDSNAD